MEDSEITEYINQVFSEDVIRRYENQLLAVMKFRFEKYPTEKNSKEWLDFSDFVCKRRKYD